MTRIEPEPQPNLRNSSTNANRRPPPPWIRVMSAEQRHNFSSLMRKHRQQFEALNKQRADARREMTQTLFTGKTDEKLFERHLVRWPELKRIWHY